MLQNAKQYSLGLGQFARFARYRLRRTPIYSSKIHGTMYNKFRYHWPFVKHTQSSDRGELLNAS